MFSPRSGILFGVANTTVINSLDVHLSFPQLLDVSFLEMSRAKTWELCILEVCDIW